MSKNLTQARLKEVLHYDPETGIFTWIADAARGRVKAGWVAGCVSKHSGYRLIRLDGKLHRAARLAVLYMTGELPPEVVDHTNGVRSDDRWVNLKTCTSKENSQNLGKRGKGLRGASLHKASGLWRSRILSGGSETGLGYFKTADEAHQAYLDAKKSLHRHQPTYTGRSSWTTTQQSTAS